MLFVGHHSDKLKHVGHLNMFHSLDILIVLAIFASVSLAQPSTNLAPGGPGNDAHWPSAAKDGFGTATTLRSKVWFTLTGGVMTEVFYPTVDTPNTQSLRFILCRRDLCQDEAEDTTHSLRVLDKRALSFQQVNTARGFTLTKTYTTDTDRSTVLIDVDLSASDSAGHELYLYYDPSLKNSGRHDTAWTRNDVLFASDDNVTSALISSAGFERVSSTFAGVDDQPARFKVDSWPNYERAENGNVVQIAKMPAAKRFTIALAFGSTAEEALRSGRASL